MTKILLASASLAQLAAFATVSLGIEVPEKPKPTEASLRALIASVFSGEEIEVADEAMGNGEGRAKLTLADIQGRKTVRINIPVQEHIGGGDHPVPVGLNGKVSIIKRGVDVDVPVELVDILRKANKDVPIKDENSTITGWTQVPIYPFSVVAIVE